MRAAVLLAAAAVAWLAPSFALAQPAPAEWAGRLRAIFPSADRFTDRRGEPPVFEAHAGTPGERGTLVGYAFLTSDLPPEQKGFNGPIEVLVGMDLAGTLTGVVVTDYIESHRATRGDFLAEPGFQEQFSGKSILDAFQVRRDVDGISGATITVDAMSRGVRNAAREVASAYGLAPVSVESGAPELHPLSVTQAELVTLSWTQLVLRGLVQRIPVLDGERMVAEVALVYARDAGVAEALVGPAMLAEARARAGSRADGRHVVVAGVDGPSAGSLNLARLAVAQGTDTTAVAQEDVLLFGPPRQGALDGQVRMTRILLLDGSVDMAGPLTWVLDLRPGLGIFTAEYGERPARSGISPDGRAMVEGQGGPRSEPGAAMWWAAAVLALVLPWAVWRVLRRGRPSRLRDP